MCLDNSLIVLFNYLFTFKLYFFKLYFLVCVKTAEKSGEKNCMAKLALLMSNFWTCPVCFWVTCPASSNGFFLAKCKTKCKTGSFLRQLSRTPRTSGSETKEYMEPSYCSTYSSIIFLCFCWSSR